MKIEWGVGGDEGMNKKGESGMSGGELIKLEEIQSRIYTIRGVQVTLEKDLAIFYDVKLIGLREQVNLMVSQNAIPSKQRLFIIFCTKKTTEFTENTENTENYHNSVISESSVVDYPYLDHLSNVIKKSQFLSEFTSDQKKLKRISKHHLGRAYTKEKSIAKQAVSQFETNIGQQAVDQLVQIEAELSGGEEL